ncbi:MAG: hypothetical protein ACOX5W_00565 [Bacillota bacterium]
MRKTCPYCGKDSFSACSTGEWICPHCFRDISKVEPKPINYPILQVVQNNHCDKDREVVD